ncbi:MAG TPA: DUF1996 domain-containing protein [Actinomycetota bacterium]|nr:DUF1996 domain-containing protein [Actinomycetota bacterium]
MSSSHARMHLPVALRRTVALALAAAGILGSLAVPAEAAYPQGQFIIQCLGPVRSAPDDPIVSPGAADSSHLHEFYGNTAIHPSSTYESLIVAATGCEHSKAGDEPGDTASYWHPTVSVNGARVAAPKSTFYYSNRARKKPGTMKAWPAGLKAIAGNGKATSPQSTSIVYWGCGDGSSVSKVNMPPQCKAGDAGLTVHVIYPDCWDGVRLDSPDHKSHLAYSNKSSVCPSTHPVSLPWLMQRFQWTNFYPAPSSITLSSGPAYTFHSDFWNTWNQARLEQLVAFCINAGKKCVYADLDNLKPPA